MTTPHKSFCRDCHTWHECTLLSLNKEDPDDTWTRLTPGLSIIDTTDIDHITTLDDRLTTLETMFANHVEQTNTNTYATQTLDERVTKLENPDTTS